jgi:hypothetical protein
MPVETAPGPLLHGLTMLAFILHISGGAIGLVSGLKAIYPLIALQLADVGEAR